MNTVMLFNPEKGFTLDQKDPGFIQSYLDDPNARTWIDLEDPEEDELDILMELFHFHPLSIEDCIFPQNRPKMEDFKSYLFLVVHGIVYDTHTTPTISLKELDIFIGSNFIVTVHNEPMKTITFLRNQCREKNEILTHGPDTLLHMLMDNLVDSYFPILNHFDNTIDDIEDSVFNKPGPDILNDIFNLKRDLMSLRRVIYPQQEIIQKMVRREVPHIQTSTQAYFRDINDHLARMMDMIDTFRESLTSALEIYMSVSNNKLNDVMKTLTIIATIMMPGTLIASFYGMNFKYLPHQEWVYGPVLVLALIVILSVGMLYYFHKRNWI